MLVATDLIIPEIMPVKSAGYIMQISPGLSQQTADIFTVF
jgi:hypothetical protein